MAAESATAALDALLLVATLGKVDDVTVLLTETSVAEVDERRKRAIPFMPDGEKSERSDSVGGVARASREVVADEKFGGKSGGCTSRRALM